MKYICYILHLLFLLIGRLECNRDQFQCGNGNYINKAFECDGDNDCKDGTDEHRCGMYLKFHKTIYFIALPQH